MTSYEIHTLVALAWILQNRNLRRQRWHAADVAATVEALACQKLAVAALNLYHVNKSLTNTNSIPFIF